MWLRTVSMMFLVGAGPWPGMCLAQGRDVTSAPRPVGRVAGRVVLSDTNTPARMATVSLEAVNAESEDAPRGGGAGVANVQTSLDGSYSLDRVAPGTYYVIVEKDGYLSPRILFSAADLNNLSSEMQQLIARTLPRVKVEAGGSETVDVRLERAAAVNGRLRFDDGSPASGLDVRLMRQNANGAWEDVRRSASPFASSPRTDDRGEFRIASVPGGTYILHATLALADRRVDMRGADRRGVPNPPPARVVLQFYGSGTGTSRTAGATSFTVGDGQERVGVDMTVSLSKLHTVTGRVAVSDSVHLANSGRVLLVNKEDRTPVANTSIDYEDSTFRFAFVPDGNYFLQIKNVSDVSRDGTASGGNGFRIIAQYADTEVPFTVDGDMSSVVVSVQRKGAVGGK